MRPRRQRHQPTQSRTLLQPAPPKLKLLLSPMADLGSSCGFNVLMALPSVRGGEGFATSFCLILFFVLSPFPPATARALVLDADGWPGVDELVLEPLLLFSRVLAAF